MNSSETPTRNGRSQQERQGGCAQAGRFAAHRCRGRGWKLLNLRSMLLPLWRRETMYADDNDFVFPSERPHGEQPRSEWPRAGAPSVSPRGTHLYSLRK